MIERREKRLKSTFDIREIHDPPGVFPHRAADMDADNERMTMQASALVPGRYVWQTMSGLDLECLVDMHAFAAHNGSAIFS